jgi:hypothetical protein
LQNSVAGNARQTMTRKDNVKRYLKELDCEDVNWNELAKNGESNFCYRKYCDEVNDH